MKLSVRIAVGSSDGKVVNQHFGVVEQFYIFDVKTDSFDFVEKRDNDRPCDHGSHSDDKLQKSAQLISDCKLVLVSRIGPGAKAVVGSFGIDAIECGFFIEDAILKLQKSNYFIKNYLAEEGS